MAEFTEVWKQWTRMCGAKEDCTDCPMRELGCNLEFPCNQTKFAPEVVEAIVMKWAKENPEKRYPTWRKWLAEQGVVAAGALMEKAYSPIPANIAEKLELEMEPKEG